MRFLDDYSRKKLGCFLFLIVSVHKTKSIIGPSLTSFSILDLIIIIRVGLNPLSYQILLKSMWLLSLCLILVLLLIMFLSCVIEKSYLLLAVNYNDICLVDLIGSDVEIFIHISLTLFSFHRRTVTKSEYCHYWSQASWATSGNPRFTGLYWASIAKVRSFREY